MEQPSPAANEQPKPPSKPAKPLRIITAGLGILLALTALAYGYLYLSTPAAIRKPQVEHFHFRTQIIVDGKAVDFSQDKFQEAKPGACTDETPATPFHFHDRQNQMTHVHWDGMTGGQMLKYYGWNHIGGTDTSLGWRFDDFPAIHNVQRLGAVLPTPKDGDSYYIYTGDEHSYSKKSWNAFLQQNLEEFFGAKSRLKNTQASFIDPLFPKALAHGHEHETESGKTEEELTRINNLIGNMVIFAQQSPPTDAQIKARFNALVPLTDSSCGG